MVYNDRCTLHNRHMEKIPKIMSQYQSSITRNGKQFFPNLELAWQRSYHDRIIRNRKELENIRDYMFNNPLNWTIDAENEHN